MNNLIDTPWCWRRCNRLEKAAVEWDVCELKDRATCIRCGATGHLSIEVLVGPRLADGGQDSPADPHKGAPGPEDGTPADTRDES